MDSLAGVHVALLEHRVDLGLGAVHDLLQTLHYLPRPRRYRRRGPHRRTTAPPLPPAPAAAPHSLTLPPPRSSEFLSPEELEGMKKGINQWS